MYCRVFVFLCDIHTIPLLSHVYHRRERKNARSFGRPSTMVPTPSTFQSVPSTADAFWPCSTVARRRFSSAHLARPTRKCGVRGPPMAVDACPRCWESRVSPCSTRRCTAQLPKTLPMSAGACASVSVAAASKSRGGPDAAGTTAPNAVLV